MKKILALVSLILAFSCSQENVETTVNNNDGVTDDTAVDMGLMVYWATRNIGAKTPEDYGDYFCWGETETRTNYDFPYQWGNYFESFLNKYNTVEGLGIVDNKTQLDPEDDAAHIILGGDWRMPTIEEWYQLMNHTTWTPETKNNVKGILVTSELNGNSIFIPAAGRRSGAVLYDEGDWSYSWSSSLNLTKVQLIGENESILKDNASSYYASCLAWHKYEPSKFSFADRICGLPVRPVSPVAAKVSVETLDASDISVRGATLHGKVSGGNVSECWFLMCYSTDSMRSLLQSSNKIPAIYDGNGNFSAVYDEEPDQPITLSSHSFLACAIVDGRAVYSNKPCTFNLPPVDVDMGLSVKWSATNLGTIEPESLGCHAAWGADISSSLAEGWRLPSKNEWQELIDNCTVSLNSCYYFDRDAKRIQLVLTSNITGNSLTIPVDAFTWSSMEASGNISYSYYWTSDTSEKNSNGAYALGFAIIRNSGDQRFADYKMDTSSWSKTKKCYVRAVKE